MFNPATIPAGSMLASITMTVTTTARSMTPLGLTRRYQQDHWPIDLRWLAIAVLLFACGFLVCPSQRRMRYGKCASFALVLFVLVLMVGCGGVTNGNGGAGTPTGAYPITVLATTGTTVRTTTVNLVVN